MNPFRLGEIRSQPGGVATVAPAEPGPARVEPEESRFSEVFLLSQRTAEERDEQPGGSLQAPAASATPAAGAPELKLDQAGLTPQVARRLARIIWDAMRRGCRGIELKLRPDDLGRLQLRIQVTGRDVHVQALAESTHVVQLLLAGQQELARGLARWGLVLRGLEAHSVVGRPTEHVETSGPSTGGAPNQAPAAELRRSFFEVVA